MKPNTPPLDPKQRKKMLNELESLSGILDAEEEKPKFDDLPVLKSFVEDVPVLNDRVGQTSTDTSFIDNDPLAISDAVRRQHSGVPEPEPVTPPPAPAAPQARAKSEYERFKEQHFEDAPLNAKNAAEKQREPRNDAAEELRRLLNSPSGGKPRFDKDPSNREYQQLRQKASQVVNEIIKSYMPRIEAELRMKLETEVDRILKDSK